MPITSGLAKKPCNLGACTGGVKKIGLIDIETGGQTGLILANITYNGTDRDEPATAINFDGEVVKIFEFKRNSAFFNQTMPQTSCTFEVQQTLSFNYDCPEVQNFITAVKELQDSSCCGMVAFMEMDDNTTLIIGDVENYPVEVQQIDTVSGAALNEERLGTVALTCTTTKAAVLSIPFSTLPV